MRQKAIGFFSDCMPSRLYRFTLTIITLSTKLSPTRLLSLILTERVNDFDRALFRSYNTIVILKLK